ncbi:MAG: ATP-grasp domain-containing protein [Moorea sp. SIO2B7]|nr:ATP-grasp domain-containing protein [Moorena sp. SIO2B7]
MTNYIITGNSFSSSLFPELSNDTRYKIIAQQDLIKSDISFDSRDKICVSLEEHLDEVYKHHKDKKWVNKIKMMKDKYEFREVLKGIFPDFYFEKLVSNDIPKLKIPENKKVVIKPVRGFMATGVSFADKSTDLEQLRNKLQAEISERAKYFTNSVVSSEEVIVEEFIQGDEYASDSYITSNGEIVILNITAHPTHEKFHYLNALYHTNYEMFFQLYDKVKHILSKFHSIVDISNIPIHAEFKLQDEQLIPIEFNPVRFGGTGYADLTYYFFDVNPFKSFFEGKSLNPSQLWQGKHDKYFGRVLAYNGKGLDIKNYQPDYNKIKSEFSKVFKLQKLDYQNYLTFAVLYVEEKNLENLMKVLKFEFRDFFKKI